MICNDIEEQAHKSKSRSIIKSVLDKTLEKLSNLYLNISFIIMMILLLENTISFTQECDSGPSFSYFTNSNFYFLFCLYCPFLAEKCALV